MKILQHPTPPVLLLRGRRIPVGDVQWRDDGWCWVRRVRRQQRGRLQAHLWQERDAWVIGRELFNQVAQWASSIYYLDEEDGEWRIPTSKAREVAETLAILGEPHLAIATREWDYKPPAEPKAVQTVLFSSR